MPEADTRFAEFPAEVHFFAAKERSEVHQSDVQVLNDATEFLNLLDGGLQALGAAIALLLVTLYLFAVNQYTAQHNDAPVDRLQFALSKLEFGFQRDGFTHAIHDLWQKAFGFVESEASRHGCKDCLLLKDDITVRIWADLRSKSMASTSPRGRIGFTSFYPR